MTTVSKANKSFSLIQQELSSGITSVEKIVDFYLLNIEKEESQKLNAFLEVFAEEAKQRALEIDKKIQNKTAGKLAGMVIGIKDNLCYKGHKVSAASKILEGFESLYNATVVERLLNEDAIIIGRLNCDEFAMGGSNENSAYKPVLNPFDNTKVSGGSSGGSAVAVAADLCTAALGTDTGGSIRQPAAFNGVVGLKPTYGRVSRYGCIAYASSFDQIGPITNTVEDAALILEVIAGGDEFDATVSSSKVPEYSKGLAEKKTFKIAFIKDCIENQGLDPAIAVNINEVINKLRKQGHTVEGVSFPYLDYVVPTYYVLTTAEASSNLSRYDGIHYGYRSKQAFDLESTYKKSRSEGFGKEVKRRIMLGTFVLSSGYYDAYYSKAQKVRRLIKEKTEEILSTYDFILSPTTPTPAFDFGRGSKDPILMYLEDIFTVQANLAGIPAISIPTGSVFVKEGVSLPIGTQLMGKAFDEANLLLMAQQMHEKIL